MASPCRPRAQSGDRVPTFDLVQRFGVRVYLLPDLPEPILYLRAYRLALVDSSLDADDREAASDLLLASALDSSTVQP